VLSERREEEELQIPWEGLKSIIYWYKRSHDWSRRFVGDVEQSRVDAILQLIA
jgi:hypothetical protein